MPIDPSTLLPIAPPRASDCAGERVSAGALIVAQMRPALVKYFRRKCGAIEEAEDLAQDVLVNALAHIEGRTPEQAKGYIFRSAVNRWRDRQRRAFTRGTTVEWDENALGSPGGHANEEIGPERVFIVEQALHQVALALLELSERTRDVFILVRIEQMKQSAVAAALGVSVSTVEKELVRALAHLARCASRWDAMP